MDENQFEMAGRLSEAQRQQALDRAARRAAPETHPDFDGTHCVECGDAIPAGRLALLRVRCVACQSTLEKRRA